MLHVGSAVLQKTDTEDLSLVTVQKWLKWIGSFSWHGPYREPDRHGQQGNVVEPGLQIDRLLKHKALLYMASVGST